MRKFSQMYFCPLLPRKLRIWKLGCGKDNFQWKSTGDIGHVIGWLIGWLIGPLKTNLVTRTTVENSKLI